jgi:outer membrane receptor protein involved in Fe transport
MLNSKSTTLLSLLGVALAQPIVAVAQERESRELQEVVVTAQKRSERLIDVPMSITAISGTELEQKGLSSIQDLSFAVPGLTMREDGPGSYTIFMRGLSNQYGFDALVGVYLDEAPLSLTGYDQLDSRVLDLERVEVLKGPQGTLYGQGSLAGAVRYITKAPRLDAFEGRVEASEAFVSDGDTRESLTGIVNIPVVEDKFGVRVAARVERGGGWQDQPAAGIEDGNNQDLINVRAKALWQMSDAFKAEAMVVVHRNESDLGLGYENPDRTVPVAVDPARRLIPKEFEYELYNVNLSYQFPGAELLSSSTYTYHDHQYPFSYEGGPETIYGGALGGTDERWTYAKQYSQELRLVSTGEEKLAWTIGAYYRDLQRDFYAYYDTTFGGTYFGYAEYIDDDTYESISVFADAAYQLTPRFKVGAGVRYFEDDQTTFDGTATEGDSFDSVDPRVYASFAVTPDVNLYASAASGFRSGGFNAGALPNYEPETLRSYELGVKGSANDRKVDFEVAAYMSDYDDMLRRGLVFVPGSGFLSLTSNIGKVEVKGLEAGVTLHPTRSLALNATAAYIDSEITEVNATDATSLAGDPVDYTPETSFTVGAHYGFNWSADMPGYVRFDYSYRDEVSYIDRTSFPPENLPQRSDSIGLLDARIGLDWRSASFELFGTNLTDENKWIDPYHAWNNANRTRPRVVGVRVGINFD